MVAMRMRMAPQGCGWKSIISSCVASAWGAVVYLWPRPGILPTHICHEKTINPHFHPAIQQNTDRHIFLDGLYLEPVPKAAVFCSHVCGGDDWGVACKLFTLGLQIGRASC